MALNDTQKQSVLFYLGWPGKTIVEDTVQYNSQTADRLINLTSEIETRVVALLSRLKTMDERLDAASSRLAAKRVDTVETNPDEIPMLKKERKRLSRELSQLLDIPMLSSGGPNVSVCV